MASIFALAADSTVIDAPVAPTKAKDPDFAKFMQAVQAPVDDKEPEKMHTVLLHNDNSTPYDVVIDTLVTVFGKTPEEAEQIMWSIHRAGAAGKGAVGAYPEKDAQAKVDEAHRVGHSLTEERMGKRWPKVLTFSSVAL
jgi:ATP-dependent Clp protease adaptor protein ClpS